MTESTRRPRALLVAYACDPRRGSEAAVGWNRAVEAARFADTWMICEESESAGGVRQYFHQHGSIPGLEFHFLPQRQWESLLWRVPGLGYLAYHLWHRRVVGLARRLHQQHRFDLVHQVNFTTYREPGYAWELGIPLVWGPVGGTQNYPYRYLGQAGLLGACGEALRSVCNRFQLRYSRRVRRAARAASALLAANSTVVRDVARVLGVTPTLFPDAGIAEAPGRSCGERRPGPLRILWAGRLVALKALGLLIEALARLPEDVAYELRVVGGGPQRRRWQRLARRRGVEPHATWVGQIPHRDMPAEYQWADVFAFTSLRENMGTVVLEALGAGLPVVCLDHQGAGDVVTDQCGIKIPLATPEDTIARLTDALASLARDPDYRQRLGRGAHQRAQRYVWRRQGEEMAAVYRRVLETATNGESGPCAEAQDAPDRVARPEARRAWSCAMDPRPTTPFVPQGVPPTGCETRDQGEKPQDAPANGARSRPGNGLIHLRRRAGVMAAIPPRALLGSRAGDRFGILLYHRIAPVGHEGTLPECTVRASQFERQIRGLLARGYTPWPLGKVLASCVQGKPIPPKTFVVTFDDGYECIYHEAWPILRELNVPVAVFVVTDYLDTDRPLCLPSGLATPRERLSGPLWRSLSSAECAEMLAGGLVELGSHGHTHADFWRCPDRLGPELRQSLEALGGRFGIRNAAFAFPFGHASAALAAEAERAGVSCALTTHHALVAPGSNRFDWGRFVVEDYDSGATLAAKLDGWYSLVQDAWYWWRGRAPGRSPACP